MKKFKFSIHGNPYEVEILQMEENTAIIDVNGVEYTVEVDKTLQVPKTPKLIRSVAVPSADAASSAPKTASPGGPKGTGHIKSPLPGVILNVLVKEGDSVSIGQKLMVLEAMKMENNIESDKQGRVTLVKVKSGDNVMEGDILLTIGD